MKLLKYSSGNNFLFSLSPYSFRYQLPRAIIAFAQLINMVLTNSHFYFGFNHKSNPGNIVPNLFDFEYGPIFTIFILLWAISGWLPQLSSIFHAYFSFSFFGASLILEGGDQLAQIITLLLIPICLFDKRINIWGAKKYFNYKVPEIAKLFSYSCVRIIQIQIAIVYLFAATVKTNVAQWTEGSALYYWFNHTMGASDFVKSILNWLINSHFFSPLINWSILLLEFLLFGALFMNREQKKALFLPAIIFHLFIGLIFGLWAFSFTMCASLMFLLTPSFLYYSKRQSNGKYYITNSNANKVAA